MQHLHSYKNKFCNTCSAGARGQTCRLRRPTSEDLAENGLFELLFSGDYKDRLGAAHKLAEFPTSTALLLLQSVAEYDDRTSVRKRAASSARLLDKVVGNNKTALGHAQSLLKAQADRLHVIGLLSLHPLHEGLDLYVREKDRLLSVSFQIELPGFKKKEAEPLEFPPCGSHWRHRDGDIYQVESHAHANVKGSKKKYPRTVVYSNVLTQEGHTGRLDEWYERMTKIPLLDVPAAIEKWKRTKPNDD